MLARLRKLLQHPLTLPRSSLSRVVALPQAPLAQSLPPLWSRLLGSRTRVSDGHTSASHPALDAEVYCAAEERLERKIVQHIELKITEVHQRLDAFELRVVSRPAPQVDVSTLLNVVENL